MKTYYWFLLLSFFLVFCKKTEENAPSSVPAPILKSDFTPPQGADRTAPDPESPAYFRLMVATSTDGLNFKAENRIISDQANVSDMIYKDKQIFLYYTGWKVGSQINKTAVAISSDLGKTWVFKHINLLGYGTGNLQNNADPDAILLPDGTVRLFITTAINHVNSILCYESKNGIDFQFVDIAISSPPNFIFDSNVFYFKGMWNMYAINNQNPTHWYLQSTDGVRFKVVGKYDFKQTNNAYFVSDGYEVNGEYRIFASFNPNRDIHSFSTQDGKNWTFDQGVRLKFGSSNLEGSYLKDPSILKLPDNTYFMVYTTRIP